MRGIVLDGHHCMTVQDSATGKFLSLFNLDDAEYVHSKKPTSSLDYTTLMKERIAIKYGDWQFRPWRSRGDYTFTTPRRIDHGDRNLLTLHILLNLSTFRTLLLTNLGETLLADLHGVLQLR